MFRGQRVSWEYDDMLLKKGRERDAGLNGTAKSSASLQPGVLQELCKDPHNLWGEAHLVLLRSWGGWPSR